MKGFAAAFITSLWLNLTIYRVASLFTVNPPGVEQKQVPQAVTQTQPSTGFLYTRAGTRKVSTATGWNPLFLAHSCVFKIAWFFRLRVRDTDNC